MRQVAVLDAPAQPLLRFLDAVLRGVGQVMLQNNRYTGLFVLAGIFYNSTLLGLAAVVGTVAGTATAMLLPAKADQVRDGWFGFNGTLVAIALMLFLQPVALTWVYVVIAAALSTVLMAAMLRLLEAYGLPVLTAPFVVVALCVLWACAHWGPGPTLLIPSVATVPAAVSGARAVSLMTLVEGSLVGLAQVFFQDSAVTGVLFALGLAVSSRRACALALAGSLTGLLAGWALGADEHALRAGLYGFNSVLTAVALGSVYWAWGWASAGCTLAAALGTALVFAAAGAVLEPLGLPVLTLPFVLVTWAALLAGRWVPGLKPGPA